MLQERAKHITTHFGYRLSLLRSENGLTQNEFCKDFFDYDEESSNLIPTVSSWEQNRRYPTVENIIKLAMYYGVSCDYLFGLSDERVNKGNEAKKELIKECNKYTNIPIPKREMLNYNKQPVFVTFLDASHEPQWGILNYDEKKLQFATFDEELSDNTVCFMQNTLPLTRNRIASLSQVMDLEHVWIEIIPSNDMLDDSFNGRYVHSKDKTHLVKMSDETKTLSYKDMDTKYRVFKG